MLLVIHNLPLNTRYADVKALIKEKCGLTEMIVDNLVAEGTGKKVTVGLADEGDAALLARKINGLYLRNQHLYVEDIRQKKTNEQPYRPGPMTNQYKQEQYKQPSQPQFEKQMCGQQDLMQFQPPPLMSMDTQLSTGTPATNFGVPFYMTAQNQNVGNNSQFMVQYPKVQGSMGNESYEERNVGFGHPYGGRKGDPSRSPNRGPHRERSPRQASRWNHSDSGRLDGRRSRDRPAHRDFHHNTDQFYKDKSYRDSFQSRSNQDFESNKRNNNKFENPPKRSGSNWERPNRSTFSGQNEPYRSNDNRNINAHDRRFNQEREPQTFRENNYSKSHGSEYISRPGDFAKKRPYESPDKNTFGPQNKKFGGNQQFNARMQQSGDFSFNYQDKNKNWPQGQTKGPQMNKPQFNKQPMKYSKKQANFSRNCPAPTEFKKPTEDMLAKQQAWRVQAASVIASQIVNSVGKVCNKRNPVLLKLKASVRARIDAIIGDDVSVPLKDIFSNYREKFQDDKTFYKEVVDKVAKGEEGEFDTKNKGTVSDKKIDGKQKAASPGNPKKLPKYPDGDKKIFSQLKQAQKEEMMNESMYNMDAEHEKALEEELNMFNELAKQELENPENETEKCISKFMNDFIVPDLRKVLMLHVRKRILDVRTNLSVRVICQYKAPKRNLLDAYLKDFGVVSMKASDKNRKVLIAICDSYESFDALCKVDSAFIDNLKVSFKPLHITGPPMKTKLKKQSFIVANSTTAENNSENSNDVAATIENKIGNDELQIDKSNDAMNTENNSEDNKDNISSDVQKTQAKTDSECEIVSSNKIEDNMIKPKDFILNNEIYYAKVVALDEAPKSDAITEEATGNAKTSVANNGSGAVGDEGVTFSDDVVITKDNKIVGHEASPIVENDNIADDDLEDF